jgi:hypothetical protein
MGWEQKNPTPITTDNSTAQGIANDTIKQRRSKAIDMRYYWVRDRVAQQHFVIMWAPGKTNLGDYHTKHHSARHHREVRPFYVREWNSPKNVPKHQLSNLRGCVDLPLDPINIEANATPLKQIRPVAVATELLSTKTGVCAQVQKAQVLHAAQDASTKRVSILKRARATVGLATAQNLTTTSEPTANKRGLLKRANKSSGPAPNAAGINHVRFAVEAADRTGKFKLPFEHTKAAQSRKRKTTKIAILSH